ncbi:MAG: hypothetical protein LUB61_06505 [Eggerthellaceae bacterium]|nr:hypothetical protein [Eggerthellaceae bacterium]
MKERPQTRLGAFLSSSVFDFILVCGLSACMILTVSFGFNAVPDLRGNPFVASLISAIMIVILFWGSWSKRMVIPSAIAEVAVGVIIAVIFFSMVPDDVNAFEGAVINDVPENYGVYGLVAIVIPPIVYLLTRRPIGAVITLVLVVITCGFVQYAFREWTEEDAGLLVSGLAFGFSIALVIYQTYRRSVYKAERATKTAFGKVFGFSVVASAVTLVCAAGLFYGVIAGLGLSTPDIRPFRDYFQRPVVEYSGVYNYLEVDNPEETTDELNDTERDTADDASGGNEGPGEGSDNPIARAFEDLFEWSSNSWNEYFAPMGYETLSLIALIIAAAIIAAIVTVILLRRHRRQVRLKKWETLDPSDRIEKAYPYFASSLEKLGFERNSTQTPLEYAFANRDSMTPFEENADGTEFLSLVLIHQKVAFGNIEATEQDWKPFRSFYNGFHKKACSYVGKRRWMILFWKI